MIRDKILKRKSNLKTKKAITFPLALARILRVRQLINIQDYI
ncbi:MAG: hypothetical protein ACI93P_002658, partial [bacterium]